MKLRADLIVLLVLLLARLLQFLVQRLGPTRFSGVAVEAMEKVDRLRSMREPSRMPASTPTSRAEGTIRIMTHIISLPVSARRRKTTPDTSSFDTVDQPQSP